MLLLRGFLQPARGAVTPSSRHAPSPISGLWVVTQIPWTSLSVPCCLRTRAALRLSPRVFRAPTGHPGAQPWALRGLHPSRFCASHMLVGRLLCHCWPCRGTFTFMHIQLKLSVGVVHLVKGHLPHQRDWEGLPRPPPLGTSGAVLVCPHLPFPVGTRAHLGDIFGDL